jgi:hypothetical protein
MDSQAQKKLYEHLKNNPNAYITAQNLVNRILASDPHAMAELKGLSANAHDPRARNALQIIAVVFKYEHPEYHGPGTTLIGGIASTAKFVLSPVAWVLSTAGKSVNWAGSQIQHLAKVL